ncbi:MAG TPA: hypothetical protein DIW48_04645 [Sphaerochaeta sp.]|nr:hypothetical protein [Sphaerochaeta sp.]
MLSAESKDVLVRYSDIDADTISWLWKPFIAYGKITTVQGDPGEGKSSLMLSIAAAISSGKAMPDGSHLSHAQNVIYQCSEDGVADTIKPRLITEQADCSRIAFINEDAGFFSLDDEKLRFAISEFRARLVVIDPIQSYLGDADLSYAGGMRRILHRLSLWASAYACAIVLVGHLNKNGGSKGLYRGLGSIDVVAAARSVLQIDHLDDRPDVKRVCQIKNNLATRGADVFFRILPQGLAWIDGVSDGYPAPKDTPEARDNSRSKQETGIGVLRFMLAQGPMKACDVIGLFESRGISRRTLSISKKMLAIRSSRKAGQWFWELPGSGNGGWDG